MITLEQIVAQVESGGFSHAYRFEPVLYQHRDEMPRQIILDIMRIHHCNQLSAAVIYSSSYGLYQIMGMNLYGPLEYKGTIFDYCMSEDDQNAAFEQFTRVIRTSTKEASWDGSQFTDNDAFQRFARFYNGPGNVAQYMGRMQDAANALIKQSAAPST